MSAAVRLSQTDRERPHKRLVARALLDRKRKQRLARSRARFGARAWRHMTST